MIIDVCYQSKYICFDLLLTVLVHEKMNNGSDWTGNVIVNSFSVLFVTRCCTRSDPSACPAIICLHFIILFDNYSPHIPTYLSSLFSWPIFCFCSLCYLFILFPNHIFWSQITKPIQPQVTTGQNRMCLFVFALHTRVCVCLRAFREVV